jgi:hypothetical protein
MNSLDAAESVGSFNLEVRVARRFSGGAQVELRLPWGETCVRTLDPLPLEDLKEAGRARTGSGNLPETYARRLDAVALDSLRGTGQGRAGVVRVPPTYYGTLLFEWLFQGATLECYRQARDASRDRAPPQPLDVRLGLDARLPGLLDLRWECLYDPRGQEFLSQVSIFSRFLIGGPPQSWPVEERPLRVLLAVANPTPAEAAFTDGEVEAFVQSVKRPSGLLLQVDRLPDASVHLGGLRKAVAEPGRVHGLVLLARAVSLNDRPFLQIADETGRPGPVPPEALASALQEPTVRPPFLVFLASPSVEDPADYGRVRPFAPPLIQAGVQGVVTIQGPLGIQDLCRFTKGFFDEVVRTGLLNEAASTARRDLAASPPAERWDWAFPELVTRAPEARWYQPLSEELETRLLDLTRTKNPRS